MICNDLYNYNVTIKAKKVNYTFLRHCFSENNAIGWPFILFFEYFSLLMFPVNFQL